MSQELGGNIAPLSSVVAAAHELKSPLVLIRQLAIALQDETLSVGQRERLIQRIRLSSERGLRLTSDLTRSSRLQDSLFDVEPLDPIALCQEVSRHLWPVFAERHLSLQIRGSHSGLVLANRDLLQRILCNFNENALRYANPETKTIVMSVNHQKKSNSMRIGVRDYGPSIPTQTWRTLVQRLGKQPQPLGGRPESSGLGLLIAMRFAQAMHGRVGAIRHRDGATFYVELPVSNQLSLL